MRTAWQTAFSSGPGYEDLPAGHAVDGVGYYVDYTAKTARPEPRSVEAPISLIQWALGWNERTSAGSLDEGLFLRACERLLASGTHSGQALLFPYSVPVPKYGIRGQWLSAHGQGQAASVFVRAFYRTGETRWAEAAKAAAEPLLVSDFDLITTTGDGPVLEEAPSRPRSQILNGWITALWGLRDVAGLGEAGAAAAFDLGVACLRRRIELYDVGWWTRYSLFPHRIEDLAKPIYHRFHVTQVEVMAGLTGHPEFHEAAERWRGYDRPTYRIRALAQKGAFVALRANRPPLVAQATPGATRR